MSTGLHDMCWDCQPTLPWDYFPLAHQASMIALNGDEIGGLPSTQDLPVRRSGRPDSH